MARILTLDAYRTLPRPQLQWIVHKLIPRPGIVLIMGPPKGGKTSLAVQLGAAVASGSDFLGQKVSQGTVLYVQVDPGEMTWRYRLTDIAESGVELGGSFLTVHPDDIPLPLNILLPEGKAWFQDVIKASDPDMVIVDVLREIHTADENDSTSMKSVGDALIKTFKGRALILLHHTRKIPGDVTDPDPVNSSRGSSYLPGRADVIWLLYKTRFKILNRLDEDRTITAQRDAIGLWTFPTLEGMAEMTERCLALCEERPDLSHLQLSAVAKERWSLSRATYFRAIAGRTCAHTKERAA